MIVDAIKAAISDLPADQRHSLAIWLNEFDYDAWDREMVADFSPGGRGMDLVDRVSRAVSQGQAIPFREGLKQSVASRKSPRR